MDELAELVRAMADDLDHAARSVPEHPLPITGNELREYFRRHFREHGVEAALVEARRRYAAQVEGLLLPLPLSATPTLAAGTPSTSPTAGGTNNGAPAAAPEG